MVPGIIPSAGEVHAHVLAVVQGGRTSPGNPVAGRQGPGSLRFVEPDGLLQGFAIIEFGSGLGRGRRGHKGKGQGKRRGRKSNVSGHISFLRSWKSCWKMIRPGTGTGEVGFFRYSPSWS